MLQPKRTKYRKAHKGRIHGAAKGGYTLSFGAYGLKATTPGRLSARQIEAARRTITRHMKRVGKLIFDLASRNLSDLNIIGAANPRAKLYGGFAQRALERYGATVELLPVAVAREEFGVPYRQAVGDRAHIH